ncbi:MAG: hypothetical protein J7K98_00770, partial [Candidatus Aenigmarchaeota archaeon]|nr:hypothetical protein [Candidatus Aenigmarchaeota archaeon]
ARYGIYSSLGAVSPVLPTMAFVAAEWSRSDLGYSLKQPPSAGRQQGPSPQPGPSPVIPPQPQPKPRPKPGLVGPSPSPSPKPKPQPSPTPHPQPKPPSPGPSPRPVKPQPKPPTPPQPKPVKPPQPQPKPPIPPRPSIGRRPWYISYNPYRSAALEEAGKFWNRIEDGRIGPYTTSISTTVPVPRLPTTVPSVSHSNPYVDVAYDAFREFWEEIEKEKEEKQKYTKPTIKGVNISKSGQTEGYYKDLYTWYKTVVDVARRNLELHGIKPNPDLLPGVNALRYYGRKAGIPEEEIERAIMGEKYHKSLPSLSQYQQPLPTSKPSYWEKFKEKVHSLYNRVRGFLGK